MKKLSVIIVVALLVAVVGALLYKASREGRTVEKPDAALEEQIKELVAEDKADDAAEDRPLDSIDPRAGSYEARVYFCRQAARRLVDKGLDLGEREISSAATLISPAKVLQYYTCKASEDLDSRWCEGLKKLPEGSARDINPYTECIKQYKALSVAGAYLEGWPQPSLEALEKKLAAKPYSLGEEILKTARPIFEKSGEGCEELQVMEERLACMVMASPQDPPPPPESAELEAKNFYYTFMAFRKNDPEWLARTAEFDLFSIKGAFTTEPYCDAAFRQMADMFCIGEKQESLE